MEMFVIMEFLKVWEVEGGFEFSVFEDLLSVELELFHCYRLSIGRFREFVEVIVRLNKVFVYVIDGKSRRGLLKFVRVYRCSSLLKWRVC